MAAESNETSRARLEARIASLGPDDLVVTLPNGWRVSDTLAHLAFWDRFVVERWRAALAAGLDHPAGLPDAMQDMINDASFGQWRRLDPAVAARDALDSATASDGYLAGLEPQLVASARAAGLERLVDRWYHRIEHLDEIDAAVGPV